VALCLLDDHKYLYLSLVALPFMGALLTAVRGRSLGFQGASIITTGCVGAAAVLS
jgi:cytochrome b561